MNNIVLRCIATGLVLGSVCLSSIAGSDLLSESQMDAVSAGAQPAFAIGNLFAGLNVRSAGAREHVPAFAQLLANAQRHAPDGAIGQPEIIASVAGNNASGQGFTSGAATASLPVIVSAATPAAGGNTLRSALGPMVSPSAMSSAASFIP